MEPQSDSKKPLELVAAVVILLLIALVLVVVMKNVLMPTPTTQTPSFYNQTSVSVPSVTTQTQQFTATIPAKSTGAGSISVVTKDGKTTYAIGEPITLIVKAKATEAIVGYDVVLPLDGKVVALTSKKGISSDFQFFGNLDKTTLSVTGTKKLSIKTPIFLNDTPLFEFVLRPVTKGTIMLKPVFVKPGQTNDSNLINGDADDVLQEIIGITITVQ